MKKSAKLDDYQETEEDHRRWNREGAEMAEAEFSFGAQDVREDVASQTQSQRDMDSGAAERGYEDAANGQHLHKATETLNSEDVQTEARRIEDCVNQDTSQKERILAEETKSLRDLPESEAEQRAVGISLFENGIPGTEAKLDEAAKKSTEEQKKGDAAEHSNDNAFRNIAFKGDGSMESVATWNLQNARALERHCGDLRDQAQGERNRADTLDRVGGSHNIEAARLLEQKMEIERQADDLRKNEARSPEETQHLEQLDKQSGLLGDKAAEHRHNAIECRLESKLAKNQADRLETQALFDENSQGAARADRIDSLTGERDSAYWQGVRQERTAVAGVAADYLRDNAQENEKLQTQLKDHRATRPNIQQATAGEKIEQSVTETVAQKLETKQKYDIDLSQTPGFGKKNDQVEETGKKGGTTKTGTTPRYDTDLSQTPGFNHPQYPGLTKENAAEMFPEQGFNPSNHSHLDRNGKVAAAERHPQQDHASESRSAAMSTYRSR